MPVTLDGTMSLIRDNADVAVATAGAEFTIVCWAKQDTAPSGTLNLLSIGSSSSDTPFLSIRSRDNSSSKFRGRFDTSAGSHFGYARRPDLGGLWFPLMMRRTVNALDFWVGNYGGSMVDDGQATLSGTAVMDQLCVGALYRTTLDTNRWNGDVAELMLWSRAWTDAEYYAYVSAMSSTIEGAYTGTTGTTNLEAYYPFSTTTTLTDTSGNSRDLSAGDGTATYAADATLYQDLADLDYPVAGVPVIVPEASLSGTNTHATYMRTTADTIQAVVPYVSTAASANGEVRIDGYKIGPAYSSAGLANLGDDWSDPQLFRPKVSRVGVYVVDDSELLGVELAAPTTDVGVYESHSAVHCSSPEIVHTDGHRYRTAATKNNSVYLGQSAAVGDASTVAVDTSQAEIDADNTMASTFLGNVSRLNEEYHNGHTVTGFNAKLANSGGIVIVRSPHTQPQLIIRVRRNDSATSKAEVFSTSKTFKIGHASSSLTYNRTCKTADEHIHILTRGDLDGTGHAADQVWYDVDIPSMLTDWGGLQDNDELIAEGYVTAKVLGRLKYPRGWQVVTAGDGTELIFGAADVRDALSDSRYQAAYLLDPATSQVYSLNGYAPTITAGTVAAPLMTAGEISTQTHVGNGFAVTANEAAVVRYCPDGVLVDVSNWTTTGKEATAYIPVVFGTMSGSSNHIYGSFQWGITVHEGSTRTTHTQDTDGIPEWFGRPNSLRMSIGMVWQDDVQGVRIIGCNTVRNKRKVQKRPGTDELNYYDWGGNAIQPWSVSALDSATPVWEQLDPYYARSDNPVTAINAIPGDTNGAFCWFESGDEAISATHYSTVRRREVITSNAAAQPTAIHASRTWTVQGTRGYTCDEVVQVQPGFQAYVAADYSATLGTGETITAVNSVADESGNAVTLTPTNLSISSDATQAHFFLTVPTSGFGRRYRFKCTVTTNKNQQIPADCILRIEE